MLPHDAIREVLLTAIDVPVIFANQNGKRPPLPYATLTINTTDVLPVHRSPVGNDNKQLISAHGEGSIELQVYGVLCWDIAQETMLRLRSDATMQAAELAGLSFGQSPRLLDIPALVDGTTYEPRALLEVPISYTAAYRDQVSTIDTVNGTSDMGTGIPQPFSIDKGH